MHAGAGRDQRLPRRILERHLGGSRVFAIIEDAGVARRRPGLEKHQPEPGARDMADKSGIDAVTAGLALDDAAERPIRDARDPGGTMAEPRQQAGDVQLAAADPDLETVRLIEA